MITVTFGKTHFPDDGAGSSHEELDVMIMFVLVCLAALVIVAIVARIMDLTGASTWRTAAAERRQRWEARFAGAGTGERRRIIRRRA